MNDIVHEHFLTIVLLCLSLVSLVLGFIALLMTRVYTRPEGDSKTVTEVEVPLMGKMKTNYPALVFVCLGFALAGYVAYQAFAAGDVTWEITGAFTNDDVINWDKGTLTVHPCRLKQTINKQGYFTITLGIPRGKTFEDVIEYIVYNHDDVGYARLYPSEEFMNYQDGNDCVLERALRSGRSYKPVPLIEYGLVPGSEGGAP